MKKSILFLFALFPVLASCNNNERGFVNPFPDDKHQPVGFTFTSDEIIKRTLSTAENELLDKTIKMLPEINKRVIRLETGSIYERNYTRAFAGVFKEGYDAFNMMYDENFHSFYQEREDKTNEVKYYERKKTVSNIMTTYDYSYGQNTTENSYNTITFLAKADDLTPEVKQTYTEDENDPEFAISAKYEIISGKEKPEFVSAKLESAEGETDLASHLYVKQSVEAAAPSDPIPGANSKNEVVLIKESRNPYGEKGEYVLPDGRKYRAVNNSLSVTRLKKEAADVNDDSIGDYYLVTNARTYTETVITSKVIQPNVPIEFLNKPIVINYREEFHEFSNVNTEKSVEEQFKNIGVAE